MLGETVSPYTFCRDLQYLINVTLENIILPLRVERKRIPACSEALNLEIQDAENKTFEYLAQQITSVCNADEDVANRILREYPKSEACFKCLGVNEDTIQGLLHINNIGFLELLDMPDEGVSGLLQRYGDPVEDIDHILSGLSKIRSNIDLIENDLTFEDDTRNLIKLVIRLTKEARDETNYNQLFTTKSEDQKIPPLFVTGPELPMNHNSTKDPQFTIAEAIDNLSRTLDSCTVYNSRKISSGEPSEVLSDPADFSITQSPTSTSTLAYGSQSHSSTSYSKSGPESYYRNFDSVNSRAGFYWDRYMPLVDGGLSVPTTPVLNGKSSSAFLSPTSCRSNKTMLADDVSPPSPRYKRIYKGPGTPPPKHKWKSSFPLHRSKSHESNLANRVATSGSTAVTCVHSSGDAAYRIPSAHSNEIPNSTGSWKGVVSLPDTHLMQRLPTCQTTVPCFDPSRRISYDGRSARAIPQPPTVMTTSVDGENTTGLHNLYAPNHFTFLLNNYQSAHKFEMASKVSFIFKDIPCAVCQSRLGYRCQHCQLCKMKVHKQCVNKSYRLPCVGGVQNENSDGKSSPSALLKNQITALLGCQSGLRPAQSTPAFQGSDPASAASSCTSSTPGSPFAKYAGSGCCSQLATATGNHLSNAASPPPGYGCPACSQMMNSVRVQPGGGGKLSPTGTLVPTSGTGNHFEFPVTVVIRHPSREALHNTGDGANPIISTQSSMQSENTLIDRLGKRLESMDSQDDSSTLVRTNSISVTLKEWDIPVENVIIGDLIGQGTFGTVYRGKWHGEVAVKRIHLDPEDADGSERLEGFKREVALLHKTRHENVVLFMGACMKPPDLAIVTQLCQGHTLYHQLHVEGRAMGINRKINIACQIAKGMGYLHAKEIVHRDLKTRNIFIESHSRVLIADSGVFNFVQFYKRAKWGRYLNVPPSWLCYLAPEILHAFNFHCTCDSDQASELPMTCSSDVFAFGTVWYELLTNEFPFKGYPAETLIYLCGRGVKPNLRIPGPKDFKELLVQCWAYSPNRRPGFTGLVKSLDRLPKLHRSPSYPSKPACGVTSCGINPMTAHDGLLLS